MQDRSGFKFFKLFKKPSASSHVVAPNNGASDT